MQYHTFLIFQADTFHIHRSFNGVFPCSRGTLAWRIGRLLMPSRAFHLIPAPLEATAASAWSSCDSRSVHTNIVFSGLSAHSQSCHIHIQMSIKWLAVTPQHFVAVVVLKREPSSVRTMHFLKNAAMGHWDFSEWLTTLWNKHASRIVRLLLHCIRAFEYLKCMQAPLWDFESIKRKIRPQCLWPTSTWMTESAVSFQL